jgi:hypothetical protein
MAGRCPSNRLSLLRHGTAYRILTRGTLNESKNKKAMKGRFSSGKRRDEQGVRRRVLE